MPWLPSVPLTFFCPRSQLLWPSKRPLHSLFTVAFVCLGATSCASSTGGEEAYTPSPLVKEGSGPTAQVAQGPASGGSNVPLGSSAPSNSSTTPLPTLTYDPQMVGSSGGNTPLLPGPSAFVGLGSAPEFDTVDKLPSSASALQVVGEPLRDEQLMLLPQSNQGTAMSPWIFLRRMGQQPWRVTQLTPEGVSVDALRAKWLVPESVTVCPLTQEVLYWVPPQDETGKFIPGGKPRRLVLENLKTRETNTIFVRGKDRQGGVSQQIISTPDCKHVFVNLELESDKIRVPYGEIVHVKRPQGEAAWKQEWTQNTVIKTSPNGMVGHFHALTLLIPADPRLYEASETPPALFAAEKVTTPADAPPLAYLFQPTGGSAGSSATATKWNRSKLGVPTWVRRFVESSTYNRKGHLAFLVEGKQGNSTKRAVAFWDLTTFSDLDVLLWSGKSQLLHLSVHPSGNRFGLSVSTPVPESQVSKLQDLKTGGLYEVIAKDRKLVAQKLMPTLPFHNLQTHMHPRMNYDPNGKSVLFTLPEILDLEPALFDVGQKTEREIQFPIKIWSADLGE